MTRVNDDVVEQLSAYMDGELPETEARFLLRRLENDAELRAVWARMQLGSQCLRGQPWRVVDDGFAGRVAAGVAATAPRSLAHRPVLRWAMAASVAALALLLAPRLLQRESAPAPAIAVVPTPSVDHIVPTPGSADLVALRTDAAVAGTTTAGPDAVTPANAPLVASVEPSDRASPLPLSSERTESPTDFPLVDTGEARRWPRSELVGASNDPALEAYLVRHNQMLANDGLGGFVPYVDVVANGQPAAAGAEADAEGQADAATGDDQ